MASIGPLIARGRSADIYALDGNRVLRRRRSGPIRSAEVTVMRAVEAAGFPVPTVHSVEGCDLTMDRVDGVDLLTVLSRKPWRARRVGVLLAELHRQLAAIPIDGIEGVEARFGEPESFVHGDLHPGNVLLTDGGPVVIDWEGAGVGPSDADTVATWLLMEIAEPDDVPRLVKPLVGMIRRTVARAFLRDVERPRIDTIVAVCDARLNDPNMRPQELERIRHFAHHHTSRPVP